MLDRPYFIENEEWYKINPNLGGRAYVLTDKAPAKAVASYEEFYTELENGSHNITTKKEAEQ